MTFKQLLVSLMVLGVFAATTPAFACPGGEDKPPHDEMTAPLDR